MRWRWVAVAVVAVLGIGFLARGLVVEKLTLKRGADAYLIGYPLVTMEQTRQALVLPPSAMNAFTHARYLPDGDSSVQVVAPSRDAYYSSAWLDLSDGPMFIEQPQMNRFWLMPVLDAWTNVFADPGTRTLGNSKHTIVIAGPGWDGPTPPDAVVYRSPTDIAWAILRIEAGPGIAAVQDGFRIAPLSDPTDYQQPAVFDTPRSTQDVKATVDGMSATQFFSEVAEVLPQGLEPDAAEALSRVGVTESGFEPPTGAAARGLADVPARVQEGMTQALTSGEGSTIINGWRVPPMNLGDYGTEYPTRAVVAREGLGANLPEDAVYASTNIDSAGAPLKGGTTYVIDMPADVPVKAFWSVSLYDERGNFLPGKAEGLSVSGGPDEPATRITVSPQKQPGKWIRSPDSGPFRLLIRLYWPEQIVLDNEWQYPPVVAQP